MRLDDVVGNEETIERLKVIARDGNMPHLIISVWYFILCYFYFDKGKMKMTNLDLFLGCTRYW